MKKSMILLTASAMTAALLFTGCATSQTSSVQSSTETISSASSATSAASSVSAASVLSTASTTSKVSTASVASKTSTVSKTSSAASVASTAQKTFTVSELAAFNGQNGKAAYIAVEGIVYDVTNVKEWKNGTHQDNSAGLDLTTQIKASPHGVAKLEGVPIVGTLK